MARLTYAALMSVDGYVADPSGRFDWAMPDETVHAFINDLERPIGTHLYGRRMYEVMSVWETITATDSPAMADYADIWRAAEKVVYSTTLTATTTPRTRLERSFDPAEVSRLKEESDLSISGPTLAAHAFRAGIVDDVHLFVAPCLVGGGLPAFPQGLTAGFDLRDHRSFDNGMVYQHYAVRNG